MTLVALDLATGRERWRVESTMPPPAKCGCFGFGPAIAGDTVYFDNPVTGQIVAVSLSSGEQKWAIDDPVDRTPGPVYGVVISGPIALGAVDQGVVVNTWWLPSGNSTGTFGLLSAADGSPIWQWGTDKQIQDFARVGDALIVITRDAGETDWRLERVDLATGKVLQTSSQAFNNGFYLQYLPEADMVIVSNMENTERVGVNPATLAVKWTAPVIEDCRILLPAMPNGNLACRTQTGLAVYQPVTAQNRSRESHAAPRASGPIGQRSARRGDAGGASRRERGRRYLPGGGNATGVRGQIRNRCRGHDLVSGPRSQDRPGRLDPRERPRGRQNVARPAPWPPRCRVTRRTMPDWL